MPILNPGASWDVALAGLRGWLEQDGAVLRPTARGFDFLSDLQALFLPED